MEELFRFNVSRPAARIDASTLALSRGNFQAHLSGLVTWDQLERLSWANIRDDIRRIRSVYDDSVVMVLRKYLVEVQTGPPDMWSEIVSNLVGALRGQTFQLRESSSSLADLFVALLILRSAGPARLDQLIRSDGNRNSRTLVEFVNDKPTLNELADLLRLIDLVLTDQGSPRTVADIKAALSKTLLLPPQLFSALEKPVHSVGIADLLVVKQHIRRYEMGEIARIENILKGETRDHSQKHTLSNERDTFVQTERETLTDQELTSTDRVSLRDEVDNTLREDTKVDGGTSLNLTGAGYEFGAHLSVAYDRASEDSKKFASEVAKDVTQKASRKVTERVQQSETIKIIETFEELEDQKFTNTNGDHISGVYQWLEKVYLAQVFSYGKHMLFDIMVPEPAASLLIAAQKPPEDQRVPVPPDPLGRTRLDPSGEVVFDPLQPEQLSENTGDQNFYGYWVAKYQVTGVEPPPPLHINVAKAIVGEPGDQGDVNVSDTIRLDDGYAAQTAKIAAAWYSKPDRVGQGIPQTDVQLGGQDFHFATNALETIPRGNNNFTAMIEGSFESLFSSSNLPERSLGVTIKTVYTSQVSIDIEVNCRRTDGLFSKWQLQTYEKILDRRQKLQADYEEKIAALQFQKGSIGPLGAADPETNRQTERIELKRSCITILNNQTVHGYDAVSVTSDALADPNLEVTEDDGAWVRWFEQAFEWDKIGYVFYPYYWGRATEWIKKIHLSNDDPLFENFLRAGYARVVIPVRIGFEDAVNFFMLTGRPWLGGGLPSIGDTTQNPLYLSITEEMKEQSGAPGDEIPVGDPWEIRLPAKLIRLRKDDLRPAWTRVGNYPSDPPDGPWTWKESTPES